MGVINVIDAGGHKHELEAVEGWRVMEIIREHGLPMEMVYWQPGRMAHPSEADRRGTR